MSSNIRPQLSLYGHNVLSDAPAVRRANQLLEASRSLAGLTLNGVTISVAQVHFGPGPYAKGNRATPHRHDELQVEYIISGGWLFTGPANEERLLPASGLVILPGHTHRWSCTDGGLMLGCHLTVEGARAGEFLAAATTVSSDGWIRFNGDSLAARAGELVSSLSTASPAAWQRERTGFLLGLWLSELLSATCPLPPWRRPTWDDSRDERVCRRVTEFIEANFGLPIRLEDIAVELGISVRHLSRLYRRHRGKSIVEVLCRLRLEKARQLLRADPDMLVKTVAYECGFSSCAYFTARYRKAFGRPPTLDR